ncbi:class I SAM-dependent methyltransferase [Baia soyae]|uniref:Methyltransferase family protein n=1 Tax=Baia soyae TaxID=1544746 RepID=A0A4R2RR42_9BACL|nr:class I SAM-dependent methyltransferase [Baia soyae]TCP65654.1 methyltransferase family protein [Baia soyae]
MHIFWEKMIEPILRMEGAKTIVEIGADTGINTVKILNYCQEINGTAYIIDPHPKFDVSALEATYHSHMKMRCLASLVALPDIEQYDTVLIDGDHNWYTVFNELHLIEQKAKETDRFPLVFFHDTEWPYARRDMYYMPDTIPETYRHPYTKKGMLPGTSELVDNGVNSHINNALYEGGEKNGVLTAIEDFLKETSFNLTFHKALSYGGLGILISSNHEKDMRIKTLIEESGLNSIIKFW